MTIYHTREEHANHKYIDAVSALETLPSKQVWCIV